MGSCRILRIPLHLVLTPEHSANAQCRNAEKLPAATHPIRHGIRILCGKLTQYRNSEKKERKILPFLMQMRSIGLTRPALPGSGGRNTGKISLISFEGFLLPSHHVQNFGEKKESFLPSVIWSFGLSAHVRLSCILTVPQILLLRGLEWVDRSLQQSIARFSEFQPRRTCRND